MNFRKKGFTLIELLVVIAIIGVLATISIIALQNARAKSRDAKRAGDMKQVQTALELFFNDKNRYPTVEEWTTGQIYSTSSGSTSTYMQIIPNASTPADGPCTDTQNTFYYQQTENGNSYNISFCLGNTTGTLDGGLKCLTPAGIMDTDCSGGGGGTPPPAFTCGDQVNITTLAGHTCNTGAPDYDTCTYDTVSIGTQCWMQENLNVGSQVAGTSDQFNNSTLEKYCFDDTSTNCQNDGALYQWDETMQYSVAEGAQGICPTGWHIPSDAEQNILDQYLNDTTCVANRVGAWDCANAGTKLQVGGSSGFEGILAGNRNSSGLFDFQGMLGFIWSSSAISPSVPGSDVWFRNLEAFSEFVYRGYNYRVDGFSVRCLKD